MSKKKRQKRQPKPEHAFIAMSKVSNLEQAKASCMIDAADDREWLEKHPEADHRERPPSNREVLAYGVPVDCRMIIKRGPMGSQIRMAFPPK